MLCSFMNSQRTSGSFWVVCQAWQEFSVRDVRPHIDPYSVGEAAMCCQSKFKVWGWVGRSSDDWSYASGSQWVLKTLEEAVADWSHPFANAFVSNSKLSSWSWETWGWHFTTPPSAWPLTLSSICSLSIGSGRRQRNQWELGGCCFGLQGPTNLLELNMKYHENATSLALRRCLEFFFIRKTTEGQGFLVEHLILQCSNTNIYLWPATLKGLCAELKREL